MKSILQGFGVLILAVILFAGGAATMYFNPGLFGLQKEAEKVEVVVHEPENTIDLELPGEKEKRVVTVEEVEAKLDEISEFSTYAGKYQVKLGKDETRYLLENLKIPFTTNNIEINCEGIVKVGYDFSKIKVQVDDEKIYISLPEAQINDNYVIWDTVKCTESNNILNPISFSQYQEMIDEIEEKGVKKVEDEGIYDKAEKNLKALIEGFLSEFEDYEIVYM